METRTAIHSLLASMLVVIGCRGETSGARPDDMSAEAHRRQASTHGDESRRHQRQYDPGAVRLSSGRGRVAGESYFGTDVYNPTEVHRRHAAEHRQHAGDHQSAAEALDVFEQVECREFPAETRRLCPLLGYQATVLEIPGGVRLTFPEGTPLDAVLHHVRCHVAFARARGREGMSNCPLYVEGASASEGPSPRTVDIVTDQPGRVDEMRRRVSTHLSH